MTRITLYTAGSILEDMVGRGSMGLSRLLSTTAQTTMSLKTSVLLNKYSLIRKVTQL